MKFGREEASLAICACTDLKLQLPESLGVCVGAENSPPDHRLSAVHYYAASHSGLYEHLKKGKIKSCDE
jgi:hypothetical protein